MNSRARRKIEAGKHNIMKEKRDKLASIMSIIGGRPEIIFRLWGSNMSENDIDDWIRRYDGGHEVTKLEFLTKEDAEQAALYLDDRGYSVRLMGKALLVEQPDPADLALVMTTYRAFTVDLAEGDTCA